MGRDMDLIRKILLEIEAKPSDATVNNLKIEGYTLQEIAYHCKILYGGGLIDYYYGVVADGGFLLRFIVGSLTLEGHEFLDKIRDDTIWDETKETIKEKGIPFILDTVKQISSAIIDMMIKSAVKGLN